MAKRLNIIGYFDIPSFCYLALAIYFGYSPNMPLVSAKRSF